MSKLLLVIMLVGVIGISATSIEAKTAPQNLMVTAGDQDFLLINSTGVEIYALYVAPHSSDNWEEDILGADTLFDGEELLINFPNKTKSKYWDLRIEDEEGTYIEWENLNLMKISTVELFYKNGKATAILN